MTAGLPDTHNGSTFHWRLLAALLIATIAAAPARAQYAPLADVESATPAEIADTAVTVDPPLVDEAPEAIADVPPTETTTPAANGEAAPPASLDQALYKGVLGNLLEAMPLDPEQRVQLQRGNAIINNAFTGRSLALLLGIASPPLMIAGLIWGIWSALNIKSAQAETRTALALSDSPAEAEQPVPSAEAAPAPQPRESAAVAGDDVPAQSLD